MLMCKHFQLFGLFVSSVLVALLVSSMLVALLRYPISFMSLHLFSDCMSFDLELYMLQIVGGVKLFIISMIFDKCVQSLSP